MIPDSRPCILTKASGSPLRGLAMLCKTLGKGGSEWLVLQRERRWDFAETCRVAWGWLREKATNTATCVCLAGAVCITHRAHPSGPLRACGVSFPLDRWGN